ncbi:hypothetical protein PAESOLCIP111_06622 [Paenibacillus solanacearum]|uniref:DUF4261 domain-containing protein n=1 Tax=Paenibacillus solanacearum TaxID=2048548 RepID=A0A916NLZ4_9BACL|nr:DUF4261 domain-containing protein [Paenibacillus solanacearum]CAG7652764.1 hypothetical protein PAESOLCIP111_06622 [Paenibacillus solanacearum]
MNENKIIIGVPGKWKNRTDIVQAIVSYSEGYIFAGHIIKKIDSDEVFELDIYDHDPNLVKAFTYASQGRFPDELISEIDNHTYTLYVIGDSGSINEVRKISNVITGLLKSGGIAVKIENSGIAHSFEDWISMNSEEISELFNSFVTFARSEEFYYSCGMQVFGLPDATIETIVSPEEAGYVLSNFLYFILTENPKLNNGETFSVSLDDTKYKLNFTDCNYFDKDELFYNPYGIWNLKKI